MNLRKLRNGYFLNLFDMPQLLNEILPKYLILPGYHPIYSAPYKDVYLDEANSSLLSIWNHKSEFINNDIYKEDCLRILSMVKQYSVTNFISDVTTNRFVIPPESYSWYATEIAVKLKEAGLKKCAVIVEDDLNMMGSLEEIANSASKKVKEDTFIALRFFSTLQDAHHWAIR